MNSIPISQHSTEDIFKHTIFFYFCTSDPGYPYLSICIAEGLKELGIPFYSNINFWQISSKCEEYLFCYNSAINPEDCSVIVFNKEWIFLNKPFPKELFDSTRKHLNIYLDDMDGLKPCSTSENFDLTFRTHCNTDIDYPEELVYWAFGLSNRILQQTSNIPNFQERTRQLLVNFSQYQEVLRIFNLYIKVSQGMLRIDSGLLQADYPLRQVACEQLFPLIQEILPIDNTTDYVDHNPHDGDDYLQWKQTGSRHYPNYYKRLKESFACACFGGWAVPIPGIGKTLVQWWDSWRFWESLAAGAVAFHVDFDKYGIIMPVMPENWRHYIGIDLDNIQSTIDRIANDPGILERISQEGRQWAIKNYSPVPTSLRFIKTINSSKLFQEKFTYNENVWFNSKTAESLPETLTPKMGKTNFIIFPDWSQAEEVLSLELEKVIRVFANNHYKQITIFIDISNIAAEDAELFLSYVTMNLLMAENLDITEKIEICFIGGLTDIQREALLPLIKARILLVSENKQAIIQLKAENIPVYNLDQ